MTALNVGESRSRRKRHHVCFDLALCECRAQTHIDGTTGSWLEEPAAERVYGNGCDVSTIEHVADAGEWCELDAADTYTVCADAPVEQKVRRCLGGVRIVHWHAITVVAAHFREPARGSGARDDIERVRRHSGNAIAIEDRGAAPIAAEACVQVRVRDARGESRDGCGGQGDLEAAVARASCIAEKRSAGHVRHLERNQLIAQ